MSRKKKMARAAMKKDLSEWYLEMADTYNWEEPNTRLTGILASEEEARERAREISKNLGPFDKVYVIGPNRRYSWS